MVNVTVFGGTGAAGKLFVERALAAGHTVTALARNPEKLEFSNAQLTVVRGTLADEVAIAGALKNADGVVSLLGPRDNSPGKELSEGMSRIIAAIQKRGVRRLIQVSTPSAVDPADGPDLKFALARRLIKFATPNAYEEIIAVAGIVRRSDRDWTLVRIPFLTNGPKTGRLTIGLVGQGGVGMKLSRANLAEFLLQQLTDTQFIRKAPLISNG